jgi:hypothetical protein
MGGKGKKICFQKKQNGIIHPSAGAVGLTIVTVVDGVLG